MNKLARFLTSYHILRILGLSILGISVLLEYHLQTQLSFSGTPHNQHLAPTTHATPELLIINSLGIQLGVKESAIKFGIWEINPNGASHLASSANPGDKGSIIIYAHNTNNRFGYLSAIKPASVIKLRSSDNSWHTYKVVSMAIVGSSNINILNAQHSQELVLYTCYGFADLQRFVVRAVPV